MPEYIYVPVDTRVPVYSREEAERISAERFIPVEVLEVINDEGHEYLVWREDIFAGDFD